MSSGTAKSTHSTTLKRSSECVHSLLRIGHLSSAATLCFARLPSCTEYLLSLLVLSLLEDRPRKMHLIRLLPTIVLLFPSIVVSKSRPDAVLLSSIQSLTLRNDRQTSHRRVAAVPQLNCVGGNARDRYEVDMMRCTNSGSDYEANDVQWTCRAELPEEFKLGSTDVICEGYDSAEDPYVLKGSCGVEYRLVLTGKGEERFGIPEESKFSRSNIERILFFMFFAGESTEYATAIPINTLNLPCQLWLRSSDTMSGCHAQVAIRPPGPPDEDQEVVGEEGAAMVLTMMATILHHRTRHGPRQRRLLHAQRTRPVSKDGDRASGRVLRRALRVDTWPETGTLLEIQILKSEALERAAVDGLRRAMEVAAHSQARVRLTPALGSVGQAGDSGRIVPGIHAMQ